jgi:hypothetical protein
MKKVILDQYDDQQVKDLLQGETPDGKVNTVPEVFEEFKKKPADMDLEEWIKYLAAQGSIDPETLKRLIDEAMADQTATHDDVDEIFDDIPDDPEPEPEPEPEGTSTESPEGTSSSNENDNANDNNE